MFKVIREPKHKPDICYFCGCVEYPCYAFRLKTEKFITCERCFILGKNMYLDKLLQEDLLIEQQDQM